MPALQIDGHKISIEAGRTILDAARQAGIEIPTLCWYPTLSIVGNCRICLVSVEGQPKLIPACATKVADGLVVTTRSHAAVENRRGVLKLLAERYPAEHLRNGGRAQPRNEFERYLVEYDVVPTALEDRDLPLRSGDERPGDPMIRHDMSTCILCTRCVRACEDIQVVGVLDIGQRGEHTEIIVGADGDPDKAGCTWCGECVRVCQTGSILEVMPRERIARAGHGRPSRGRARTRSRRARRARWERRCATSPCWRAWTWTFGTGSRPRRPGTSRSARPRGMRPSSSRRRSSCA